MLILVCGLPATGKSIVADVLSKEFNAPILRTDDIRKKLFKKPTYTNKEKSLVYRVMFVTADYFLKQKIPCILDGTFSKEENRKKAYEIAKDNRTKFYLVECVCSEDVVKQRIKNKGRHSSDADWKIYLKIKKEFEPIKEKHILVNTSNSSFDAAQKIIEGFKAV